MKRFESEIGGILDKFRDGELNYAEAISEIEALVMDCLGFNILKHDYARRVEIDLLRRLEEKQEREAGGQSCP